MLVHYLHKLSSSTSSFFFPLVSTHIRHITMACGAGCCSPPKEPANSTPSEPAIEDKEEKCDDDCCSAASLAESAVLADECCNQNIGGKDTCCQPQKTSIPITETDCCAQEKVQPVEEACRKGCCSSPHATQTSCDESSCSPKPATSSCQKGCCSKDDPNPTKPLEKEVGCQKGCCSKPATLSCQKGCCSKDDPNPTKPLEQGIGCQKGCCSKTPSVSSDAPPCCEGKPAPCCNDACIERLALRECKNEKTGSQVPDCHQGTNGKACATHAQKAQRSYKERLEAIGCICRALVARGHESCCAPSKLSLSKTKFASKATSSRTSVDSCCGPAGVCGAAPQTSSRSNRSCADSCCGDFETEDSIDIVEETFPKTDGRIDPEKGQTGKEHVIISISGMTCTGCETKLKRTLGTLDSITNLKTSLVLARAEFDLNLQTASPEEVIKHLERTTEFKCERVASQGSSFDLVCTDPKSFVKGEWPDGVTDVRVVDKKTIRVDYEAKITGARDLIERGWGTPMELAPVSADPTLNAGSRHVRHMGFMTVLSTILTIPVLIMVSHFDPCILDLVQDKTGLDESF